MIPKIQKILYATDLSPNSDYAFRYAINAAKQHDANIVILHVLERLSDPMLAMLPSDLVWVQRKKTSEEAIVQIKDRLKLFFEKELQHDPDYEKRAESIEVLVGYPADAILKQAEKLNCDMIVMGSHGKGVISQTFLGSVTKQVLRRTRKPIFIVPLPKGETNNTAHNI
jgi:nucleotide-binding universal stress UspA family protein